MINLDYFAFEILLILHSSTKGLFKSSYIQAYQYTRKYSSCLVAAPGLKVYRKVQTKVRVSEPKARVNDKEKLIKNEFTRQFTKGWRRNMETASKPLGISSDYIQHKFNLYVITNL